MGSRSRRPKLLGLGALLGELRRFVRCRQGNVAITFAGAGLILVGLVFGAVDFNRATTAKQVLQDSLDAATLFAARSSAVTEADLQATGAQALAANLANMKGATLQTVTFKPMDGGQKVVATASADVPTTILGLIGKDKLRVGAEAEVTRSTSNVEVALVLDTTGSMAGSKIDDLKVAAADLVDIVVQDVQTPFYSKVALVPYSMAVNVGSYATQVRGSYSSGTCNQPGCNKFKFKNPYNDSKTHTISTCVTERSGGEAYTDAAPSSTPLGRNYPSSSNPCLSNTILPLSSNKTTLKNHINGLDAEGSTGGHIGVAWGWYLVSPNFAYLWPSVSQPAAYKSKDLIKAVVIMTDGEYNSVYCKGVISEDSTSGSGSTSDHINCDAPNGNSYDQAQKLCENMKKEGVVVYTVGFNVINTQKAKDLVAKCATSSAHVHLPSGGAALKDAFRAIAQDISRLRISR